MAILLTRLDIPNHLPDLALLLQDHQVAAPFFGRHLTSSQVDTFLGVQWAQEDIQVGSKTIVALETNNHKAIGSAKILQGELSYFVAPSHQRSGVASAMISTIFQEDQQVPQSDTAFALVARENIPSIRLLEKHQFRFAGLEHRPTEWGRRVMLKYIVTHSSLASKTP